jgi:hypothetical protein
MIEDFIEAIEETFGKYKAGMRKAIEDQLTGLHSQDEIKLVKIIVENYDMGRPPNLKILLELMYKHKITIKVKGYGGMSVCEFCKYEYDQDLVTCPKCDKIRKYGAVRMYKMGEGKMHPFEISERKKQREKEEPSAEEIRKFHEYLAHTNGLKGLLWGKIKNLRKKVVNDE